MEQLLTALEFAVVGKTTDPANALQLIEEHHPDVLLTDYDVSTADLDLLTCLRRARETHPELKVVVLSSTDNPQQIEAAFSAGAAVYCVKTADREDVVVAVRQAFQHSIYMAQSVQAPAARGGTSRSNGDSPDLTRRELEILRLVAEGHSNAQLARMLWVTEQTVKFHLSNIYRKLDVANRTEASRWAQLNGLLSMERKDLATAAA
jgi:DNA-binding NarL/FixJ family response regulator